MGKTEKRKLIDRLKNRYRLVIMNDETLEEKAAWNLRPLNVFVTTGLIIILLITITTFIIAFTGLREYIPGYSDVNTKRRVYNLMLKTDSMDEALRARDQYINNIRNVIEGNVSGTDTNHVTAKTTASVDTIHKLYKSKEDEKLRKEIESQDRYTLTEGFSNPDNANGFVFFPPVKGTITSRFDPFQKHYGIDIVAGSNEAIKAALDGTVIMANFTSETGYVIGIQHSNNLFSLYKHNSALLKKPGDFVKAGEVIAIIGNTGEFSQGPHLHFELWLNGTAVNPQKYIAF